MGEFTVIKQQWLIIQKDDRHDYPREGAIIDIIKAINKKHTDGHDIVVCLDDRKSFVKT